MTDGDIARIHAHTGAEDFWEPRLPASPDYAQHDPDDPNWLAYTIEPDGTRRVLKRSDEHGCTFLGEHGCRLPESVRPLVCRLYPFAYTERGIEGEDSDYCPTGVLAPPGSGLTMLKVLNMSEADGRRWHRQLYDELRERAQRLGRVPTSDGARA